MRNFCCRCYRKAASLGFLTLATALLPPSSIAFGQTRIEPADGSAGDFFGNSVAVSGSTVVVGSEYNDTVAEDAGAVYVYQFDAGSWLFRAKLTAADGAAGASKPAL